MADLLRPKGFGIVAVVAAARNGVIGQGGAMPWHIPSDLRRYREWTMGRPMIMGRRTLESIGRVLDGRDTIVLTRSGSVPFEGAIVAADADEALDLATSAARARGANEIVIAGGAEIYGQFLSVTSRIAMTVVEAEPAGDTWFPPFDAQGFVRTHRESLPRGPKDGESCRFEIWDRR